MLTDAKQDWCEPSGVTIGDHIRQARQRAGLSQRQLATLVGVTHGAVAQWEGGGGGKGISTENLIKVARTLGMALNPLLDEAQPDPVMTINSPIEQTCIHVFRLLSPGLQRAHIALMYEQAGTSRRDPPDQAGNPTKARRIVG